MMSSPLTVGMLRRNSLLLSFRPVSSMSGSLWSATRSCRCHSLWIFAALLEFVAMSAERISVATVGASRRLGRGFDGVHGDKAGVGNVEFAANDFADLMLQQLVDAVYSAR